MATAAISVNAGGVSRAKSITRDGTVFAHSEALTAAKPFSLTTRTDADTGVLTFGADPGITSGTVDVAWTDATGVNRRRWQMTVTAYDEGDAHEITVDAGTGDNLPAVESAVTSYTDLVIDDTDNTVVTSAAHPFTSADEGRILKVSAGTGFTIDAYTIESVSTAGAATLSAAVGTVESTGGTAASYEVTGYVAVRQAVTFTCSGDAVKMISLYSEPPTGETASRAVVDFIEAGPASIQEFDIPDNEPFLWADNGPITNPLAAKTVTALSVASLTDQASTLYIELVYDASP